MSIFQKLFGESSKKAPASKAGQWDAVLGKCDLLMARDEIAGMHGMLNAQAEKEGGHTTSRKNMLPRGSPIATARPLTPLGCF